jgi:Transposase DDE domain
VWTFLVKILGAIFKMQNKSREFAVDSFPVPCCKKSRIDRRRYFLEREFIGYAPADKRYFCGIKVHMVVTGRGEPVEVVFRPASHSDLTVLWDMELDLPENSSLYADGAYACFDLEDLLAMDSKIRLLAKYKRTNTKRVRSRDEERRISSRRQIVETAFSWITGLFPRYIRACTERGFLLRVMSAVLAYSISCAVR